MKKISVFYINTIIKNYENVYACCEFFLSTKFVYHLNDIDFGFIQCASFKLLMLNYFDKCDKKTRVNFAKNVLV